ncbi:hotdog fold thioesterase [Thiotrichales bacterium 19S11-10]|nr:hotdog fold thioesterase [Thiotrichales bacterium 19S11-10]
MKIWKTPVSKEDMNQRGEGTLSDLLGIIYTEVGDDYVKAEMPITDKVKQPIGIMNGGASCVIAESVGSCAANYAVDITKEYCVGLDINTNHIRAVYKGKVEAIAKPFHIGRTTQVWSINIYNEADKLVSVSRLTMAVRKR